MRSRKWAGTRTEELSTGGWYIGGAKRIADNSRRVATPVGRDVVEKEESRGLIEAHDDVSRTRLLDRIYIDPVPPPGYHHPLIGSRSSQGRCHPNLLDVFQGSGPDICTKALAIA